MMDNAIQKEKWLDEVRHEIDKSGFELDHRAALHRTVNQAGKLMNGHSDKMGILFEAFAEKLVRDTRQEVNLPKELKQYIDVGIKQHTETCMFARRSGLKGLIDRLSEQYPVLIVVLLVGTSKSEYFADFLKALFTK